MTKQPTLTKADLIEEVLRVTELARRESETIVETIFESIIGRARRPQPENWREGRSQSQEDSVFQAQQRAEGLRQHRRRRQRLGFRTNTQLIFSRLIFVAALASCRRFFIFWNAAVPFTLSLANWGQFVTRHCPQTTLRYMLEPQP